MTKFESYGKQFGMRYLSPPLAELANEKFVLVSGPRQVGKTTLAKAWLAQHEGVYLNWDSAPDRERIRTMFHEAASPSTYLVLDEIHKHVRWKRNLKGLFDHWQQRVKVVVTGSARLDVYQRGGDSMLGRYESLRLHPFSVGEVLRSSKAEVASWAPPLAVNDWLVPPPLSSSKPATVWERLRAFSGFPEPYTKATPLHHGRWSLRRRDLVLREDIRDISQVRHIALVEDLASLLPARVGSPLSINALREDLGVAFDTVKQWLTILERLYYCFRLAPFSTRIARSLTKENKLYLWDWTEIADPAARFENMVASHLLKAVQAWRDLGYGDYGLSYWRDREKREVDFIITLRRQPVAALECKQSDVSLSPNLKRFGEWFPGVALIQLVDRPKVATVAPGALVASAADYLRRLV